MRTIITSKLFSENSKSLIKSEVEFIGGFM